MAFGIIGVVVPGMIIDRNRLERGRVRVRECATGRAERVANLKVLKTLCRHDQEAFRIESGVVGATWMGDVRCARALLCSMRRSRGRALDTCWGSRTDQLLRSSSSDILRRTMSHANEGALGKIGNLAAEAALSRGKPEMRRTAWWSWQDSNR
jgi:hypothetical protein